MTPLLWAAKRGNKDFVERLLLRWGIDVNFQNNKNNPTALHYASGNGHEAVVRLLIENGADVNARYEGNYTVLHTAAITGHETVVQLLIEKGADVNSTPLCLAIIYGSQGITRLLAENRATK